MKKKIRFIINPISGVGSKGDIPNLIREHLDQSIFEYDIAYTEYRKHAKKIAKESADQKYDVVCAVGGDGSVHEVGTALIGSETKLAILPAGSGNGLARHLNIPLNLKDAILCINKDQAIKMDTVLVNDKSFLGIGGYGFDAVIAKKFDTHHKRGLRGYIYLIIREFFKYNPINVSIDLDGKVKSLPVVLCTVANASQFGNGFTVSPKSDVTDGKLELCLLKPFSIWSAPYIAYRFFRKSGDKSRFAEIIPFKKAKIRLSKKIAHYDGEPFDVKDELNISVVPKSLNILVG
ncbi:MAG: diacylglycerol kinase family lipid kinase [Crocinitomicaceae bacterium]|nr:diacylglycerol kinase family lipid kinase [Crocinitomicaceae bacterium]